jgi:hypothetical protein
MSGHTLRSNDLHLRWQAKYFSTKITMAARLTAIIDEVLREALGPHGLDHVKLEEREDHDGEPALFIDAVLKRNAKLVEASVYSNAHMAVSYALLSHGENRFPYLYLCHPRRSARKHERQSA